MILKMCWSLRVYLTVCYNLLGRLKDNVVNAILANKDSCLNRSQQENYTRPELILADDDQRQIEQETADYVIVDDVDANYVEINERTIETESYYLIIDRYTAEDLLLGRENGACLVRPFKQTDVCIKYIASIYAKQQFFHLFIRQMTPNGLYGIGQSKCNEKLFRSPVDIIEFYSENYLLCTNKVTQIRLKLKPISM